MRIQRSEFKDARDLLLMRYRDGRDVSEWMPEDARFMEALEGAIKANACTLEYEAPCLCSEEAGR